METKKKACFKKALISKWSYFSKGLKYIPPVRKNIPDYESDPESGRPFSRFWKKTYTRNRNRDQEVESRRNPSLLVDDDFEHFPENFLIRSDGEISVEDGSSEDGFQSSEEDEESKPDTALEGLDVLLAEQDGPGVPSGPAVSLPPLSVQEQELPLAMVYPEVSEPVDLAPASADQDLLAIEGWQSQTSRKKKRTSRIKGQQRELHYLDFQVSFGAKEAGEKSGFK